MTVTEAFKANGFYMEHCIQTKDEIERIENELTTAMNSENKPQSFTAFKKLVSSDIVDSDLVCQDYIDYKLVYQEGTTWEDFISQFLPIE